MTEKTNTEKMIIAIAGSDEEDRLRLASDVATRTEWDLVHLDVADEAAKLTGGRQLEDEHLIYFQQRLLQSQFDMMSKAKDRIVCSLSALDCLAFALRNYARLPIPKRDKDFLELYHQARRTVQVYDAVVLMPIPGTMTDAAREPLESDRRWYTMSLDFMTRGAASFLVNSPFGVTRDGEVERYPIIIEQLGMGDPVRQVEAVHDLAKRIERERFRVDLRGPKNPTRPRPGITSHSLERDG